MQGGRRIVAKRTIREDDSFIMREAWTCLKIACKGLIEREKLKI